MPTDFGDCIVIRADLATDKILQVTFRPPEIERHHCGIGSAANLTECLNQRSLLFLGLRGGAVGSSRGS